MLFIGRGQYYSDFECVVVDDCSTDDFVALIRVALDEIKDSRFRFIERDLNGGQMAAMFTGFDATTAPFVAFLDADDVWLPTFLEKHIACHMNLNSLPRFSCCNLGMIDTHGTLVAGTRMQSIVTTALFAPPPIAPPLKEVANSLPVFVPKLRRERRTFQSEANKKSFMLKVTTVGGFGAPHLAWSSVASYLKPFGLKILGISGSVPIITSPHLHT